MVACLGHIFKNTKGIEMNLNPTLYITELFFSMKVAYPGHILDSTKGIEIKLGTHIDVNERKYRRQEP